MTDSKGEMSELEELTDRFSSLMFLGGMEGSKKQDPGSPHKLQPPPDAHFLHHQTHADKRPSCHAGQSLIRIGRRHQTRDLGNLTKSGESPSPLSSRTLFWVGFVFCSPVELGCFTKGKKTVVHFSRKNS